MDVDANVHHWFSSAQHDLDTADVLQEEYRAFDCLVSLHACVEKMAKGLWVLRRNEHPPVTGNVLWLLKELDVEVPDEHLELVFDLTVARIRSEWPLETKHFRKGIKQELAADYLSRTEGYIRWLKSILN